MIGSTLTLSPEAEAADIWYAAGCTPIAINADGSKSPVGRWRDLIPGGPSAANLPFPIDRGLGIICGSPSNNLEMLEFEGLAIRENNAYEEIRKAAYAIGIGGVFDAVADGYREASPKGGLHLFYRLSDSAVTGSRKVAQRPARQDEWRDDERAAVEAGARAGRQITPRRTLVETRGQGGYVIVAPTRAACSDPLGPYGQQPWQHIAGHPANIAVITTEQRNELHRLVHSVLDVAPPAAPPPAQRSAAALPYDGNERPGDKFARETRWADILGPLGWTYLYEHGGKTYWRRPGKDTGVSATTTDDGPGDPGGLYVFTTSTVFEAETLYTKFGAHAHLEHGGNHAAAAGALAGVGPEPIYSPFFTDWLDAPTAVPQTAPNGTTGDTSGVAAVGALPESSNPDVQLAKLRLAARIRTTATIDDVPLPHYIVTDWLFADEIAQIIGASGSMKSFVAIDLAASIATGREWHGHAVERHNVMFVAAEGGSGIRKRLRAWEKQHEGPAENLFILDEPVQIASRIGGQLQASFEWQALAELVHATGTRVLFVDTQARSTVGVKENDNSEMGVVFDAIEKLRRAVRNQPGGHAVTVVLVHHTGKAGTDGRGASAMYAAVNSELKVTKSKLGAGNVVKVENSKNKDDEAATPLYLQPQVIPLQPHELSHNGVARNGDEATTSVALLTSNWRPPREELQGRPAAVAASDGVAAVCAAFVAVIGDTRQSATKAEIRQVCEAMPKTTFYNSWNAAKDRHLIAGHASGRSQFMITSDGRAASGIPESPDVEATP